MASLRARNELGKERTNLKVTDAVPGSEKRRWTRTKAVLAEYNKKKSKREAEERRAARTHKAPYDKIREALEELEAISHPNEEQEQL
jgi:aminopeptidase N